MAASSASIATGGPALANKVVFVFVPGAFHTTDYFQPTRDHLREKGFESVAIGHKSMELDYTGAGSFHEDATKVEEAVSLLLDEGKDVVLVMHSFGGIVGTEAIGHLFSQAKPTLGDQAIHNVTGRILSLVYVTAFVLLEGEFIQDASVTLHAALLKDKNSFDMLSAVEMVEGKMFLKSEIKEPFYHHLPEPDRNKYYTLLQGMPAAVLAGSTPLTHAGWLHVRSTFVYATADRIIPPAYQKSLVDRADQVLAARAAGGREELCSSGLEGHGATKVPGRFETVEMDSDHCSMFVLPKHVEKLGEVLIKSCS